MKKVSLLFCLLLSLHSFAQEQFVPSRPEHFTPVVDSADVLTSEQETALTQKIKRFEDSTGTQIGIVILASLKGYNVESYAFQWFKKWEYGRSKNNNGVLLFAAINDRRIHIETGYGLEGAIPDAYAKRIIEEQITPNFKETNYYAGIDEAVDELIRLAGGEAYTKEVSEPVEWYWYVIIIVCFVFLPLTLLILAIVWIVKAIRKNAGGKTYTKKGVHNTKTTGRSNKYSGTNTKKNYSDYSDYSDKSSYSDYSDYSDSSGGSSGGGGASGSW